ncbi:MAG: hypothetical protein RMK43_10590, partial [Cyclobacteriaceae bacterium]|nr:hypothetical protein [Cyclobacteriaceae bacterium]
MRGFFCWSLPLRATTSSPTRLTFSPTMSSRSEVPCLRDAVRQGIPQLPLREAAVMRGFFC